MSTVIETNQWPPPTVPGNIAVLNHFGKRTRKLISRTDRSITLCMLWPPICHRNKSLKHVLVLPSTGVRGQLLEPSRGTQRHYDQAMSMWTCTLLHALGMVRVVGGDMCVCVCVCGEGGCLKKWDIMSVQDSHTHTQTHL